MYQFYRSAMKRFLLFSMLMLSIFHFEILNAQQNPPGLGFLGSGTNSVARDITADGNIVVGDARDGVVNSQAFRWTAATGMVGIGLLNPTLPSLGFAASEDGSVVVGAAFNSMGIVEAFRWTANDSMQGLGFLPGDNKSSDAVDVSADGAVIVGNSIDSINGGQGFRWTTGTGMVALPAE